MSEQIKAYIPPLAVSRALGVWHFEDGGFVAIVCGGNTPSSEMIEMAQTLIDMKRKELSLRSESPVGGKVGL